VLRRVFVSALLVCTASAVSSLGAADHISIATSARAYRPGELVVVTVTAQNRASGIHAVTVHGFDRTVTGYKDVDGQWRALIGIDLEQPPGRYPIEATIDDGAVRAIDTITVTPRTFPTRRLTVAPDFVNPPPALLERITKEQEFIQSRYAAAAAERLWTGPFRRPVPGRANSSFGTRSIFNNEPRNPHTGTDFLSPGGTPIHAPAGGRIVAARDLFFSGNTVLIDHGLGLFSMLAHMSKMIVHEGDRVAAGDVVGLVGATGRVTGAHLHWTLLASGARVDPLSALELLGESGPARPAPVTRQARPSAR
jgi:murein DD-endopeptidase MepM/ murein hydrolase activator NlpD